MSLGGSASVRGYKDQQLTGDSGGYWRNDLRWSRPVTLGWLRPVFGEYGASVGYDQGVIRNGRYNGSARPRLKQLPWAVRPRPTREHQRDLCPLAGKAGRAA